MSISENQIKAWENANSPFLLPNDLKSFYCFSDGLLINWNIQFKENSIIPLGQMQVNSLEKLTKIHISMNERLMIHFNKYFSIDDDTKNLDKDSDTTENKNIKYRKNNKSNYYDATSSCILSSNYDDDLYSYQHDYITNGNIMSGYLLYDCKSYGTVILLYHSKLRSKPQVWFLDNNNEWNFLSPNFISYFRLMVKNFGIYGWQLAYTKKGLYQSTLDWLSFYAPDRVMFYNQKRDYITEDYNIKEYNLNNINKNDSKKSEENITAGDNSFVVNERTNDHELFLLKYFSNEKNYSKILNYKEIKKIQLNSLKKVKIKKKQSI
ncbi:hypothetical protein H8356DRAFT_1660976 [Neocallimastix lanati (nom. inval.)]|nr:hypothetical protein H8356DRAFT_1660976 [Neocallimastix sp. JGI-2020a]